ncbi:MAG: inositol monophosphatase [Planctomycetota bacterium]
MSEAEVWGQRLLSLGFAIQRHLHQVVLHASDDLALPVAHEGGDTIFAIDRHVEPIIEREVERWPNECKPLVLIAEGFGEHGRRMFGSPEGSARYRVILDPIDGTRNLMYDKRSAWFIAAVSEDYGEATSLTDTFAAVLVELPTTKQAWCDSYMATRDTATIGFRTRIGGDDAQPLKIRPSRAETLRFGFGQVSNFFPGTKVLAAELMERIASETLGQIKPGESVVFDDQYICTGGQMVELMVGHDRFCCDLRPLFYRIHEKNSRHLIRGVECHPYDVAGSFVAKQAGVVITDGFGKPLNCPMDVHTGIHWCGFANEALAKQIQPIINEWLADQGLVPD